jgi:hypothetical protein
VAAAEHYGVALVLLAQPRQRLAHQRDHLAEYRRLRAVAVVHARAVGHEAEAVDQREQVAHHARRRVEHAARGKPGHCPQRVPVVRLTEASAGPHERVRQRQQRKLLGWHAARHAFRWS